MLKIKTEKYKQTVEEDKCIVVRNMAHLLLYNLEFPREIQ